MTVSLDRQVRTSRDVLTRRRFMAGALGFGVVLLGCGDEDRDASSMARGDFPITMTHKYGSTTIPGEPKRVVAAGFNDADFVLAFGVVPVGVADFIGPFPEQRRPWARAQLDGASPPLVSDKDGKLRFERIAALDPDLIVFYNHLDKTDYKRLSAIAPTVVEPRDGALWPQHTLDVGRALGREEQARELVQDVEAQFAQTRRDHPEFAGKTVAVLFGAEPTTNFFLLERQDPRSGLFRSLGLKLPPRTGEISREQARLLDQDLIAVVGTEREVLEKDALFRRLDAAKEGRVAYLGGFETAFAGALGFDSPLSLPSALELATPVLAAAIE